MTTRKPNPHARRHTRAQGGFAILEALVALVIFAIGTLGILGLQATMTRAQSASKYRADAANLAQQVVGQMWSDAAGNRSQYASNCNSYAPCAAWEARVAQQLPAGNAVVAVNGSNVDVTVTWTVPNDGTNVYRTTTAISTNP
jgi:type IV pilus assembly protein PilV